MDFKHGCKVLRGKYGLIKPLTDVYGHPNKTWLAQDDYQNEYLVKLWPFSNKANELQRALWDFELRNLYRVSSSTGAERVLLVIQDAGIDQETQCFVMVMQAKNSGYELLVDALHRRAQFQWLNTSDREVRRELWEGLRRIAEGIQLLHGQAMIHRDVCASNIYFHPDIGPSSFRLCGFEWSIRIGELFINQPSIGWAFPPEVINSTPRYQMETDWYGFGMLAARCLLNIESYRNSNPEMRHKLVSQKIQQASEQNISDIEKRVLQRLIDRNRHDRLTQDHQVITAIDDLLQAFRGVQPRLTENPLLLLYDPQNNTDFVEHANEVGFLPNPDIPDEAFNPNDLSHTIKLTSFIQNDLIEAQIFYFKDTRYILVGNKLSYSITRYNRRDPRTGEANYSWDAAYCINICDLSWSEGGITQKDLPSKSIIVRTSMDLRRQSMELNKAQSWKRYLPQGPPNAGLRSSLIQFHDFIRCTNQIELLIRDAELFQYEVVHREVIDQVETIKIREKERTRPVLEFFKIEGGLIEFLHRERESNKPYSSHVVLLENDALRPELMRRIEPLDCYIVIGFEENNIVVLRKAAYANKAFPVPKQGWLRTFGMFGQIDLIRRRKEAINRLSKHSYLLQAMSATGQVYMHIGDKSLPKPLAEDKVDKTKQAIMQDILNTRPIYALQGPPGTGKTTMVAHLLRQILDDDSVAQILVTAQAHGAVDVLWSKVRDEAFVDIDNEFHLPLAVRLGRNTPDEDLLEGSVEYVAAGILQQSINALDQLKSMTPLQRRWHDYAQKMKSAINTRYSDKNASEFLELVKHGSNITYCTTSAGDLEELARSTQTYDWSIVEEAGKCHGFDLALPMQAGHRWLLIGDHRQLPPYRLNDYRKAIDDLELTVFALRDLPRNAGGLLDNDWIRHWERMASEEREQFKQFAKNRLETFQYIFELCEKTPVGEASPKKTVSDPIGAIAGMLSWQYRMHPRIGDLISESYYGGDLKNKTVDSEGRPLERVTIRLTKPKVELDGGVLWINTPAAFTTDKAAEIGPPDARYINKYEADVIKKFLSLLRLDVGRMPTISQAETLRLAVLSPYSQQVSNLRTTLFNVNLPTGIEAKEQLRSGKTNISPTFVHTVDSFQGNEADIIIVSLVRNNLGNSQRPLGFLDEPERMNVLLSRAQRLLVIVGSWDFFKQQVEPFDINDPSRSEWHLKKAMALLEDWFKTGIAIKVESGEFEVEEMA
ncbi:MAG: AAA domain-containing protein [Syntrophomonas sp.]